MNQERSFCTYEKLDNSSVVSAQDHTIGRVHQLDLCKDKVVHTFLGNVADFVLKHHKDASDLCIVLPGRRAGLFLKEELIARIDSPTWAPTIISIEELFFKLSKFDKADDSELLLSLYNFVKKTPGHTDEPFDGFCKWAPALLADFNDVDAWLADPKQHTNLSDIKVMSIGV